MLEQAFGDLLKHSKKVLAGYAVITVVSAVIAVHVFDNAEQAMASPSESPSKHAIDAIMHDFYSDHNISAGSGVGLNSGHAAIMGWCEKCVAITDPDSGAKEFDAVLNQKYAQLNASHPYLLSGKYSYFAGKKNPFMGLVSKDKKIHAVAYHV
jgi:hypothetical protein